MKLAVVERTLEEPQLHTEAGTDVSEATGRTQYCVRGVPAQAIETFWHFALPYIKRALDYSSGELTPDDIKHFCRTRNMQLWLIAKPRRVVGAVTTEIICHPRRKFARLVTMAGTEFDKWLPVSYPVLLQWAQANGCDMIEADTRRGMARKVEALGFKFSHVRLRMDISNSSEQSQ